MVLEFMRIFFKLIYHQLYNLYRVILRRPLIFPPLSSATVDKDDIVIAKQWFANKSEWNDQSVVQKYEKKFAEWIGSYCAFAFMGGRIALSACIHALDLKNGDEVILPGYTCVVVPNAFHYAGVITIYSDIELDTYGLDASLLESKITKKTKAILLHHLYGLVCRDYEKILQIARDNKIYVIEDCAHSAGAIYKGKKVGNYGDIAFYSSEQSKSYSTFMGGVAITNDPQLARKLEKYYYDAPYPDRKYIAKYLTNFICNYYMHKHPWRWLIADVATMSIITNRLFTTTNDEIKGRKPNDYGMRMPAPIAAIGISQLNKIDAYNRERRELAIKWDRWCDHNGYKKPTVIEKSIPVYLRYPVLVEEKKKRQLSWAVNQLGVKLGVWYISNVHPANWQINGCPNANKAVNQCINFPTLGKSNNE